MELRVLTIKDREAISELFKDVFSNEPWNDDWSNREQLDAYISDLISQNNSLTFGYFDGERMAGLSMGHVKHWYTATEYIIEEFCIARLFQRMGIGSAFMNEIEAYLLKNGIRQIFLQTDRNVPAYAFYMKRGFTELIDHVSFAKRIDDRKLLNRRNERME